MGRKKREYKTFLQEDTIIASVLPSLSACSFYCIPVLMSSAHFCWIGDLEFDEEAQISGVENHRRMGGEGQSVCQ